ncbi:unnamed protein product [Lymnaea stagnalis]|uniref:Uncharacterized protein n=1 Tax=Lymnaea stagnalis TaxID=6523 RepID=A0AAV2HI98_LYMST
MNCGIFSSFVLVILGHIHHAQSRDLVVSSLVLPPFLVEDDDIQNGTKVMVYDGFIKDLLDKVFNLTKMTYTISIRKDKRYGNRLNNGTWDGLIGDVLYKRADLAVAPLTETSKRREAVDFTTPFMNFGPVLILRRPESKMMTLEERFQRLFSPLSQSVWMMSGLAWLVTSVVLYIICHVNPYDWRRLTKDRQATLREGEAFTCLNTFWFTTSTMLWQGYTRAPRSLGGRIVVTFWWLYVLIFVIMYIASMTNYLRVGPTPGVTETYTHIQTIEDLSRQKEVGFGLITGGTTQEYIEGAQIPYIKKAWSTIRHYQNFVSSLESGIERVRTSPKPFALIAESAMAKYYTKQRPCDIYMVGDFSTIGSYAMALPINSSLRSGINIALLKLRESGELRTLEDKWFSGECTAFLMETNKNSKLEISPFYTVDLGSFSGALIILGLGLVVGSLTAALETCVFKFAEVGDKDNDEERQKLDSTRSDKPHPLTTELEPITDV